MQLKGKDINNDTKRFKKEIDRIVWLKARRWRGLYGLTGEEIKVVVKKELNLNI